MDIAYISALSALAGSVVGGLTSGITTWLGLRTQMRAGQLAHNKSQREDLYRDFIVFTSSARTSSGSLPVRPEAFVGFTQVCKE